MALKITVMGVQQATYSDGNVRLAPASSIMSPKLKQCKQRLIDEIGRAHV